MLSLELGLYDLMKFFLVITYIIFRCDTGTVKRVDFWHVLGDGLQWTQPFFFFNYHCFLQEILLYRYNMPRFSPLSIVLLLLPIILIYSLLHPISLTLYLVPTSTKIAILIKLLVVFVCSLEVREIVHFM